MCINYTQELPMQFTYCQDSLYSTAAWSISRFILAFILRSKDWIRYYADIGKTSLYSPHENWKEYGNPFKISSTYILTSESPFTLGLQRPLIARTDLCGKCVATWITHMSKLQDLRGFYIYNIQAVLQKLYVRTDHV